MRSIQLEGTSQECGFSTRGLARHYHTREAAVVGERSLQTFCCGNVSHSGNSEHTTVPSALEPSDCPSIATTHNPNALPWAIQSVMLHMHTFRQRHSLAESARLDVGTTPSCVEAAPPPRAGTCTADYHSLQGAWTKHNLPSPLLAWRSTDECTCDSVLMLWCETQSAHQHCPRCMGTHILLKALKHVGTPQLRTRSCFLAFKCAEKAPAGWQALITFEYCLELDPKGQGCTSEQRIHKNTIQLIQLVIQLVFRFCICSEACGPCSSGRALTVCCSAHA